MTELKFIALFFVQQRFKVIADGERAVCLADHVTVCLSRKLVKRQSQASEKYFILLHKYWTLPNTKDQIERPCTWMPISPAMRKI